MTLCIAPLTSLTKQDAIKYPKAEQKMTTLPRCNGSSLGMRSMNAMHKTSNERKIEEKTDQEIAKKKH